MCQKPVRSPRACSRAETPQQLPLPACARAGDKLSASGAGKAISPWLRDLGRRRAPVSQATAAGAAFLAQPFWPRTLKFAAAAGPFTSHWPGRAGDRPSKQALAASEGAPRSGALLALAAGGREGERHRLLALLALVPVGTGGCGAKERWVGLEASRALERGGGHCPRSFRRKSSAPWRLCSAGRRLAAPLRLGAPTAWRARRRRALH